MNISYRNTKHINRQIHATISYAIGISGGKGVDTKNSSRLRVLFAIANKALHIPKLRQLLQNQHYILVAPPESSIYTPATSPNETTCAISESLASTLFQEPHNGLIPVLNCP